NRTALTIGGAAYASYEYDVVNRLTNLADSASQNFVYSYDVVNRLTSRSAPNGVTANFTYDGLDRLFELAHTKPPATLAIHQYAYNNANNISSWLGSSGNRSFNYDNADRLTSVLKMGGNENYGYDAVGNRPTSHLSASYSYQPFNKLTSTTTASYTYDNSGNMLSKMDASGTRTFAWDSDNRLKQIVLPGGLTVNYKYDALGRRIQRTTSTGADERFVYDGQDVLLDLNSSLAVVTSYINGLGIDDHLRQTNTATGVSYFLTDHLSTTTTLTDSTGNVVETLAYDSFGNNTGSTRTRYTYTGRERDPDTGLLYYRARFYDPQLGRFISEDPIGFAGGMNPFAYVDNNPIAFYDPLGLCPQIPDKGDPRNPCNSNYHWAELEREMKSIGKKVGGRYDKESSTITRLGNASMAMVVRRFQSAGFRLFFSLNSEHPGANLEQRWMNGESGDGHYYHVTVEPSAYITRRIEVRPAPPGVLPEKVIIKVPDPDSLPKRITIHCDSAANHSLHHLWYDVFQMTWP
ncbi:MAG TPA: RHS repeat-associated core domain-containing protein, partial [Pyrinomonadaceae bacterium]|nr:RHS repeat-associated core domain-containing protein [Pyrinomonadaceae bacterium]